MFQAANKLLAGLAWLAICACSCGWAQVPAASLRPSYWSQRVFLIPYRDAGQPGRQQGEVELLVSRDGVSGWRVLQQAQRTVSGFSFHAPEDGDYWFAVRTLGRRGAPPDGFVHPQLRVVVDTKKPQLGLQVTRGSGGGVVLRYEATDTNLRAASIKLEQQIDGGPWQPVVLGQPDVEQADRLIGRSTPGLRSGWRSLAVRGSVADAAGNLRESTTQLAAGSDASRVDGVADGVAERGPFLPPIDWPSNAKAKTPPSNNPYAAPADRFAPQAQTQFASAGAGLSAPELGRFGRALAEHDGASTPPQPPGFEPHAREGGWNAADPAETRSSRAVNALTFDLDYELDMVGPWGVSRVEIWASPDGGRSWNRLTVDPDNRSPARVTVPGSGRYGFRLVVDGANGSVARRPQPGDEPELGVEVDLQPPIARLTETRLGAGDLAGHLQLKWSATDTNLEDRPVGLFYASSPDGPWSTIATGLGNSGQYTWRLARHVPDRFYVRLEVRDRAGNVAAARSELPVAVERPRPQGRLRGARPASDVPGV
ncbi:MAG: hypothetical protein AAGA92_13705 [Planctomycetota bacterium]